MTYKKLSKFKLWFLSGTSCYSSVNASLEKSLKLLKSLPEYTEILKKSVLKNE